MPISHESSYLLDGMVSLLDATIDIAVGASLGNIDVDQISDNLPVERYGNLREYHFSNAVIDAVLQWRQNDATIFEKRVMATACVLDSEAVMYELLLSVAGPIAEAYLDRKGQRPQNSAFSFDLNIPTKTSYFDDIAINHIQDLRNPIFVNKLIEKDRFLARYLRLLREQYIRCQEAFTGMNVQSFLSELHEYTEQKLRDQEQQRQAFLDQVHTNNKIRKETKKIKRTARKAVRRGLRTLSAVVGKDAYKAFISQDGFNIVGCEFDYNVKKKFGILSHTADPKRPHIPYQLQIFDKQNNRLGSGCIVFDQTPVLDQIVALALHVRDKELERKILKTANWMQLTDHAKKSDIFCEYAALAIPETIELEVSPSDQQSASFDKIAVMSPYFVRRKKIIHAIQSDVEHSLAALCGIPNSIYEMMSRPNTKQNDRADRLYSIMHA